MIKLNNSTQIYIFISIILIISLIIFIYATPANTVYNTLYCNTLNTCLSNCNPTYSTCSWNCYQTYYSVSLGCYPTNTTYRGYPCFYNINRYPFSNLEPTAPPAM